MPLHVFIKNKQNKTVPSINYQPWRSGGTAGMFTSLWASKDAVEKTTEQM
jgi:hypothetical protein